MARRRRGIAAVVLIVAALALSTGCAQPGTSASAAITLYTCVTDTTVQPVLAAFQAAHPNTEVALFRAPTGQLNARVATDVRTGGLRADVIWACDPLTMQGYVEQGLVGGWTPRTDIPQSMRTPDYVGVSMLYLVAITRADRPALTAWAQLPGAGRVAVPDPSVAASALGAVAYFGTDFYRRLRDGGAVQVSTPDEVTTGVAQGLYDSGLTIASSAYAAERRGSPVTVSWPQPGAVAIPGPAAVSRSTNRPQPARDLVSFLSSREGQQVIGAAGSYPTLPGTPGPTMPAGAPTVQPDWQALAGRQDELLRDYATVFGG